LIQDPRPQHSTKATDPKTPRARASLGQVASTMFWCLCMIGRKNTWERDGVKISIGQAVIGGVIAAIVIVSGLLLLARWAVH
jgi:hypothetical protein